MCVSPVAAVNVEQNDDKAQAVTGQVGATKEPGESPCSMLPSCHLTNNREMERSGHEMTAIPLKIPPNSKLSLFNDIIIIFIASVFREELVFNLVVGERLVLIRFFLYLCFNGPQASKIT